MSAIEASKLAISKWPILPTEKIFEKIYTCAKEGYKKACFNDAFINVKQNLMLEELGYKVEIGRSEEEHPYFIVSW